ncbi:unnamed protein product [Rotaria sp. Silwood1]|nr:unnamed protein product [Rotaria sp. Silwood1]
MIFTQRSYILGAIFSVSTYSAFPNDNIDDTSAIQAAINKAIEAGPNNVVVFQSGTYNFKSTIGIYSAIKLTIIGQGVQQTLLLGNKLAAMFQPLNCQELTITVLAIDFDPLPFTAGYVVSVSTSYLDVQVVSPHRADVGRQVHAILRYNSAMPDVLNVGVDIRLEFGSSQQPFTVYTRRTVASLSVNGPDTPVFVFTNNRACDVLLKIRHVHITNSLFIGTSGPTVLFETFMYWHESVATQDSTINPDYYDTTNSCCEDLRDLIDLLPSGLDLYFPPPAMATKTDVQVYGPHFL